MPAEWERHEATWLSWPSAAGLSYPGEHWERVREEYVALVRALAEAEPVYLNVRDPEEEEAARRAVGADLADRLRCFVVPTDEPWCRDHGPTFVRASDGSRVAIDWDYNAWGRKYEPFDRDEAAARGMAESVGIPVLRPGIVAEGGAIETDGSGHVLTTASCLLNENRNPGRSRGEIERVFRDVIGAERVTWLRGEIDGDDTDGHIDTLARFVSPGVVVSSVPRRALLEDPASLDGIEIVELPAPPRVDWEGSSLPASYANFVLAEGLVLVPGFGSGADGVAAAILREHFPEREVRVLPSCGLIYGLGSFHCLTQQLPAEDPGEDERRDDGGI